MPPWLSFLTFIYLMVGIGLLLSLLVEEGVMDDLRAREPLAMTIRLIVVVLTWPLFFFGEGL